MWRSFGMRWPRWRSLIGVDRLADQRAPDARGDRDGDDDRNDDGVVARHFEHHDDRGHDAAGSRADHRGHADDRRRGNSQAGMRKNEARDRREGRAQRRAEIQRGREDAAGGAATETDRGGEQLQREQQGQQARGRHLLVEDRLDDAVADAVDVGMAEDVGQTRPSSGRSIAMPTTFWV